MDKSIPLIDIVMILVSNESETRGEPDPVKLKRLEDWCNEIAATEEVIGSAGLDIEVEDSGVIQIEVKRESEEAVITNGFKFYGLWG